MGEQSVSKRVVYRRASHAADLDKMRLNDELCDVTIKINDKEFRAHKVILAAGIKYFHRMFLGDFRENTQNVVKLTIVNEANLEALISFAYTGKITMTNDNVLSLFVDVDYLGMDDVKEACIGFIRANLTAEKALKIYIFANSMNNTTLKEMAVLMMLSDFEKCSHSEEYLDLEFDVLNDYITSVNKMQAVKSQTVFEGIVRWLVRDVSQRAKHMTDLLCSINIADLTADYLIAYLYEHIDPEHDSIIRTIVSFYRVRVKRKTLVAPNSNLRERLIAINRAMLSHVQYFDFNKNEWTFRYTNVDHIQYAESVVSQNKLYIVGGRTDDRCVARVIVFDPQNDSQCSSVASMSVARRECAVCASAKHLYVCGGRSSDGSDLNHVERYDLASDTWETLAPLNTARSNAAAVLFQGNIYVIGGSCKGVERYSPGVKRWVIVDSLHYSCASLAATTLNDRLYVCGGGNMEVFDPRVKKWQPLAKMQKKRYSFLVIAFDGKLLAVGGDNTQSGPTVETYDPNTNEWALIQSFNFHIKHLMGGLIQAHVIRFVQVFPVVFSALLDTTTSARYVLWLNQRSSMHLERLELNL